MRSSAPPTRIELAVAEWVKAEWFFRFGPNPYSRRAADRFEESGEALRAALCNGATSVQAAYQGLGGGPLPAGECKAGNLFRKRLPPSTLPRRRLTGR